MDLSRTKRAALLLGLVLGLLLAGPGSASAVTYEVNSNGGADDANVTSATPMNGDCDTDPSSDDDCTLRAAIQESNASAARDLITFNHDSATGGDPDDVSFSFGQPVNVITIAGATPAITDGVTISGGSCASNPSADSTPCAIVGAGVVVDAVGDVQIDGLTFTGTGTALDVVDVSDEVANQPDFKLTNSYFGVEPSGAKGSMVPPATSLQLRGEVESARIGGGSPFEDNFFARQATAIDVLGADNVAIAGNSFGVLPDGSFARAGEGASHNGDNIEITGDSIPNPDDPAENVVIGEPSSNGFNTAGGCFGGCNRLRGAGISASNVPQTRSAIDLDAESGENEIPADGTRIIGNEISANHTAIRIDDTDDVVIGGAGANFSERNVITGNEVTSAAGSSGLIVQNNFFGPDNSAADLNLNGSGEVLDNLLTSASPHPAIQLVNTAPPGFTVQGNVIGEDAAGDAAFTGVVGINLLANANGNTIGGPNPGDGNVLSDRVTADPNTINTTGIRIAGDDNTVVGNRIGIGTGGAPRQMFAGIDLLTDADGNDIGGTTPSAENVIANTKTDAIRIKDAGSDDNQIFANHGNAIGDLFIDLGDDGAGNLPEPDGPNDGAQAPAVATVTETGAQGTASPNATVRVFSKTEPAGGELEGFLAEVTADGSGQWSAGFPSQNPGKSITATQTAGGSTSELAAPVLVVAAPAAPDTDTEPPQTTIEKAPKNKLKKPKATYTFSASEPGATFLCKLDRKPQAPCSSPNKLKRLKPGKHQFSVIAVDAAGNADPTAATDRFKVKKRRR